MQQQRLPCSAGNLAKFYDWTKLVVNAVQYHANHKSTFKSQWFCCMYRRNVQPANPMDHLVWCPGPLISCFLAQISTPQAS